MLVYDHPRMVGDWMADHGGGILAPGSYTALGYVESGELIGGLAFYGSNKANCYASIALARGRFPRALLHAGLFYVFRQLGLKRLTFTISSGNVKSQRLVTKLGAKREATLRAADYPSGDLFVYSLFPEDCAIWSRINGKISRRSAEP